MMPILVVLNFALNKLESGIIKFLILPNDDNNLSTQIVVKHLAESYDLACFSFYFLAWKLCLHFLPNDGKCLLVC